MPVLGNPSRFDQDHYQRRPGPEPALKPALTMLALGARGYSVIDVQRTVMRKTWIVLFAIASIASVSPPAASARNGLHGRSVTWGGGWRAGYRWHGADWWGYGYAPSYYSDGGCTLVGQRFWNGYGWQSRVVRVCG
jgi:hypothetical protein